MSNSEQSDKNLVAMVAEHLTRMQMDKMFPQDRINRMLDEKDPKQLGKNIVQLAVEAYERDRDAK